MTKQGTQNGVAVLSHLSRTWHGSGTLQTDPLEETALTVDDRVTVGAVSAEKQLRRLGTERTSSGGPPVGKEGSGGRHMETRLALMRHSPGSPQMTGWGSAEVGRWGQRPVRTTLLPLRPGAVSSTSWTLAAQRLYKLHQSTINDLIWKFEKRYGDPPRPIN